MIKYISDAWKENISNNFDHEVRAYLNPRGIEYAPISSAGSFVAVGSTDNVPGSYNGYQLNNVYAIPFSATKTIDILIKPNFSYNVAEYIIASWTLGTNYIKIGYNHTNAQFFIAVYDSSETRVYFGPTYASDSTLKVWHRLSFVLNGSTVDAYHNTSKTSAAFDTTGLVNLPLFNIGGGTNTYINNLRMFDIACSESDVINHYKDIANRETYFAFNKVHVGYERCSVTARRDMFSYTIDNPSTYTSASSSISLYNTDGQYNDDTFKPIVATFPSDDLYPSDTLYPSNGDYSFQPELGYYNGTSNQIYLQRRVGLEIEAWNTYTDQDSHERLFIGSIQPGSFSRSVSARGISSVSVSASDGVADIAKKVIRKDRKWIDYYLTSESSPTSSLFHVIAKLATEREVYNYITNSGFENTAISNSWIGYGGTIARSSTVALFGTYSCKMNASGMYQNIGFKLSKGERLNFSAWVYSASATYVSIKVGEYINGTFVSSSNSSVYHTGNGWSLIEVTHTVVNSSSNLLKCYIEPSTTGDVYVDGCMLVYGDYKPYYVDNTADGSGGIASYTQGVRGYYDWIGIDADTVTYQHPYAMVSEGKKVWDYLKQIGDATIARYLYIDRSGVLRFKSTLATSIGSSLGNIGRVGSIASTVQSETANKVKVAGVYIKKDLYTSNAWQVEASGIDDGNTNGATFNLGIAAGASFPLAADSPDGIEARYGDAFEGE